MSNCFQCYYLNDLMVKDVREWTSLVQFIIENNSSWCCCSLEEIANRKTNRLLDLQEKAQ